MTIMCSFFIVSGGSFYFYTFRKFYKESLSGNCMKGRYPLGLAAAGFLALAGCHGVEGVQVGLYEFDSKALAVYSGAMAEAAIPFGEDDLVYFAGGADVNGDGVVSEREARQRLNCELGDLSPREWGEKRARFISQCSRP
jgi:hypothetical protein